MTEIKKNAIDAYFALVVYPDGMIEVMTDLTEIRLGGYCRLSKHVKKGMSLKTSVVHALYDVSPIVHKENAIDDGFALVVYSEGLIQVLTDLTEVHLGGYCRLLKRIKKGISLHTALVDALHEVFDDGFGRKD